MAAYVIFGLASIVSRELRHRYIAESFRMPSGTMCPTLLIGDHFYANALSMRVDEPMRGEIVAFDIARDGDRIFPVGVRPDLETEVFVRRIVGISGDKIRIQSATLWVNGEQVTGPPIALISCSTIPAPTPTTSRGAKSSSRTDTSCSGTTTTTRTTVATGRPSTAMR